MKNKLLRGFTLVELLIVIALIAILSVAVLSTINPIEQSNKARDARVQNDAAELLGALERYYASTSSSGDGTYPWAKFKDLVATPNAAVVLRSDWYGTGVCSEETILGGPGAGGLLDHSSFDPVTVGTCDAGTGVGKNYLLSTSELKSSFAGKDEFKGVDAASLFVARVQNSDSLYVCYVPKAVANRGDLTKMRCVTSPTGVIVRGGEGACIGTVLDAFWDEPSDHLDGTMPMFKCVPE